MSLYCVLTVGLLGLYRLLLRQNIQKPQLTAVSALLNSSCYFPGRVLC